MEHIIVTDLQNGYFRLVPMAGYKLYNKSNQQYYSEAVTKNINLFEAVEKEDSPDIKPTPDNPLEAAQARAIANIMKYDSSSNVNGIIVNGIKLWIPAEQRAILKTSIDAYKALGIENITKVWEGTEYTATANQWLYMINTVEVYASECYNTTARHKAAVEALDSIEAVEEYDYTLNYPSKPEFNI